MSNKERKFTGRHFLFVILGAYAVILTANLTLAYSAVSTFPGLEVKNSYVASQELNARRDAQEALGWQVETGYEGGVLRVVVETEAGQPAPVSELAVLVGRPTNVSDDVRPDFVRDGSTFSAPLALRPGSWTLRITARAEDGTLFEQRHALHVSG